MWTPCFEPQYQLRRSESGLAGALATIEELALAVLAGDQLRARALAAEIDPASVPEPSPVHGEKVAILAAALTELLALYAEVQPPIWTNFWGRWPETLDFIPARTKRLHDALAETTPEPLKRRNILAPDGFLRAV